jgi:hypothetical protein
MNLGWNTWNVSYPIFKNNKWKSGLLQYLQSSKDALQQKPLENKHYTSSPSLGICSESTLMNFVWSKKLMHK